MQNQLNPMDPGMPGQATRAGRGIPRVHDAAALVRLERQGAALVASHWLRCFDALGTDWVHESLPRRLAVAVRKVMAENRTAQPGDYLVRQHLDTHGWFPVDWRNSLYKRFKGRYECYLAEDDRSCMWEIQPFDSREVLRKPRGCTHFRFFVAYGVMCDFRYSAEAGWYVPVHPELLGLNSAGCSCMIPVPCILTEAVEVWTDLPELPAPGPCASGIMGIGLEFWAFGQDVEGDLLATEEGGRLIGRVMHVG
jgi:hypothetical protein